MKHHIGTCKAWINGEPIELHDVTLELAPIQVTPPTAFHGTYTHTIEGSASGEFIVDLVDFLTADPGPWVM